MLEKLKNSIKGITLVLVPFSFMLVFLVFPVFTLVKTAFQGRNNFSLEFFFQILKDPYTLKVLSFTVKESFVSALLTSIIGFPGAYLVSHYDFKFKQFLMSLTTVPFVLPSVIVSLGFIILFGRSGVVNSFLSFVLRRNIQLPIIYSFIGIILVHAFYNFPIVLRVVGSNWEGISEEYSLAAKSLGASGFTLFWRVNLPMLLPSILSSFSLVFIFCFLSFVIILTIGGAQFATLEVAIYMYYNTFSDFQVGSMLAVIQALILTIFVLIYLKSEGLSPSGIIKRTFSYTKRKWSKKILSLSSFYFVFVFVLIIAPMIVIILNSFLKQSAVGFTFDNFKEAFGGIYNYITGVSPARVIFNSVLFGLVTVVLSITLAIPSAYYLKARPNLKSFFIPLFMIPIVLSPLTIALSYILTFQSVLGKLQFNWLFIVVSHTLIAFPFVLRSLLPIVETTSPDFVFVARSLGMNRLKVFFGVDIKLIKIPTISASIFAFAISMGEFGATLMLFRSENTTIPIALYRLMAGRHFGAASAMGTILLLISLLAFISIDSLNRKRRPM
jgi:thiamine transport system permease protein